MDTKAGRRRRRRTTTATTIEDLSDDLTVEILSWLPLKTTVLCLGVCKRWRFLISDGPFFLTYTINVAHRPYDDTYMCLRRGQRGRGMQVSELPFSIKFSDESQYNSQSSMCRVLLASCNGLVMYKLFSRGRGDLPEYYISNPWTREYVSLPKPSKGNASHYGLAFENNPINSNSYSLGINNNNNNVALFKIVAANWIEICHYISTKRIDYTFKFEVYSSDKNRWRLLGSTFKLKPHLHDRWPELGRENAIYCNRVLYWQCCENNAFMFNLETEAPGNLDMPTYYDGARDWRSRLTECRGQLHCIRISSARRRLTIWKMSATMSNGWLISHNVDLKRAVDRNLDILDLEGRLKGNFPIFIPMDMNCQGDDKVLLDYNYYGTVSYDMKRGVFELVLKKGFHPARWEFFQYTPTNKSLPRNFIMRWR